MNTKDIIMTGIPRHAVEKTTPVKERARKLEVDQYTKVGRSKGYAKNIKEELEGIFKGRAFVVWEESDGAYIGRTA